MKNKITHGAIFVALLAAGFLIRVYFGWPEYFFFVAGVFLGVIQSGSFSLVVRDWEGRK